MTGKWTKGPWVVGEEDDFDGLPIREALGPEFRVPIANVPVDFTDRHEREANSRLIAAAPDLAEVAAHPQWSVAMGALQAWSGEGSDASAKLAILLDHEAAQCHGGWPANHPVR